jgi:hypothetical protein
MTKEEYDAILNSSFDKGTPFINITEFYSFALIPMGGDKWAEISYDLEEKSVERRELSSTKAFNMLCEEIEKGMSEAVEDFMLIKWKEFKGTLSGSDEDKIKAAIAELTSHPTTYSANLPVVLNKDDLGKVKSKI